MAWNQTERARIVARHAALYRAVLWGEASDGEAKEFSELGRSYEEGLEQVAFGRCPLSGDVQVHSFDSQGLDGPWWNYEASLRPLLERIPSCIAVTGAVALQGDLPNVPWLSRPGPGLPYVLPRLLDNEGVFATVRQLPVGEGTAWVVCYFADEPPAGALPNAWGTDSRWDLIDGAPGWSAAVEDMAQREFSLSPWIARGKLFWIAPGDDTLTLRSEVAGCPFVGLPGERREQRIAYGRLRLDDDDAPPPQTVETGEPIGDFAMIELDEGLREELRLPPMPLPLRAAQRGIVLPPGGPVNLAALLGEVQAFIAAQPHVFPAYAPVQAALGLAAGIVLAGQGDHAAALSCFDAALQIAPDNLSLRSHRALALHALERFGESREAMEDIVRSMPRGQILPLVWMLLARRYVADGEPDKARPLVDELEQAGGQDAVVARFRGLLEPAGSAPAEARPTAEAESAPAPVAARGGSGAVIAVLAALALGLGGFAAWKVFSPSGGDAPPAALPPIAPPPAASVSAPARSGAAPSTLSADAQTARIAAELPGIWAPEEGGCASGFGFAFTPRGRYAEGDEYSGEEGTWELVGDRLIETIGLTYNAEDEVSERKTVPVEKGYEYRVREFTGNRMVLARDAAEMAFVRCPEGRRTFIDGETFP